MLSEKYFFLEQSAAKSDISLNYEKEKTPKF
jgi:hypothetical protein